MKIPGNVVPEMDNAIQTIFEFMPSVMFGALASFGISYLFTIFVQRKIQKAQGGTIHWSAQTLLVATANLLDIMIFCTIAYWGMKVHLSQVILTTWAMRLAAMVLGLPVIFAIRCAYQSPRFPLLNPSPKNY